MQTRTAIESALYWLAEERKWFYDEHGGTLRAYIIRYGSANALDHYGDGGEAIYAADLAALRKKERLVADLIKKGLGVL